MNTPPADIAPTLPPPQPISLNDILTKYTEKPDLLELILLSKVEEDRRRTEEIKLRSKQIDFMLQKQHPSSCCSSSSSPPSSMIHPPALRQQPTTSSSPLHPPVNIRTPSPDLQQQSVSPTSPTQSHSSQYYPPSPPTTSHHAVIVADKPSSSSSSSSASLSSSLANSTKPDQSSAATTTPSTASLVHAKRRRRRQKMQAVTKTVETRDFPYHDDYLWKNNGNTVHKASGTKSIYYKCANHPKGCPVNKTVTFKEHGQYLIKYRGEHLNTCHRIKRVIDV
ncbi:hypothetical protein RO3G_03909 [Lichtheimia corymbifera JMRC:FSU:9682]|uniref:WRKY domain-containing protein n=1 Tax=Lichtheimia corymbifera JMRC:FSU:9682 TaxID=1263082 RepID=A0A068S5Y3_9FUNG|nr:hypothetical protein RO3G_03909 [Lichtheimia corymbifera JMRC:FSU:9682]